MVYIKLEDDEDKFMSRYPNIPKSMARLLFKAKCRKGKFEIKNVQNRECIVLPIVNDKVLKKLEFFANIRCLRNVCVSDNLRWNDDFMRFAQKQNLNIMDGKWLFKNMMEQVVDYVADMREEPLGMQEVAILCHHLDETIAEKIKDISAKVKVCNILTQNSKQFQKLEEQIYQENGIVLNVSTNYKRAVMKSGLVVNFDVEGKDLEKCVFSKKAFLISLNQNEEIQKKDWLGRNIAFFAVDMPAKYAECQEDFAGFHGSILYESLIYKKTSPRNIKKELMEDDVRILYLLDSNYKVIKNPNLILPKTLDKITI